MRNITFEIGNCEYVFQDITLRNYYALNQLLVNPTTETAFEIVHVLSECPIEDLKSLKYQHWIQLWTEAQTRIGALTGNAESIHPTFEFKSVKYGLPAIDDITVGEFADLDIIVSEGNPENKLAEIAAILYRPVILEDGDLVKIQPHDTDGYKKRKDLFQDLPISYVRSANAFFLRCARLSLENMLASLSSMKKNNSIFPEDLEHQLKSQQQDLGGDYLMSSLEKILYDLNKLQTSPSEQD